MRIRLVIFLIALAVFFYFAHCTRTALYYDFHHDREFPWEGGVYFDSQPVIYGGLQVACEEYDEMLNLGPGQGIEQLFRPIAQVLGPALAIGDMILSSIADTLVLPYTTMRAAYLNRKCREIERANAKVIEKRRAAFEEISGPGQHAAFFEGFWRAEFHMMTVKSGRTVDLGTLNYDNLSLVQNGDEVSGQIKGSYSMEQINGRVDADVFLGKMSGGRERVRWECLNLILSPGGMTATGIAVLRRNSTDTTYFNVILRRKPAVALY